MISRKPLIVSLVGASLLLANGTSWATNCTTALYGDGEECFFTNVSDFESDVSHISFDPLDERTADDITEKFDNILSFNIQGGRAAIRHTSQHAKNFAGEGTEGGPTSGSYRIDWGYYATSSVTITFENPVDAVGAFFGGTGKPVRAKVKVLLEDGSGFEVTGDQAGFPIVPNFEPSPVGECHSINGFIGIDSNGGAKITKVIFQNNNDASSLDSIFFGTAKGGINGPGVMGFPENPPNPECADLGFPAPPILPVENEILDLDGDGVQDELDQCPGTPEGITVDANGCEPQCYPQEQVEQIIAEKDAEIEELQTTLEDLNNIISTMYTQDQLDAIVAENLESLAVDIEFSLGLIFGDADFTIPGDDIQEKITNLVNAIGDMPPGQIDKLNRLINQ